MKIIVFGASGQIGSRVVSEALSRDHTVTGVARDVSSVEPRAGLDVVQGDVTDADQVAAASGGHDVAVAAFKGAGQVHEAVSGLLDGLSRAGVERVVQVGGCGSLTMPDGTRFLDSDSFVEAWRPEASAMAEALYDYREDDRGVRWSFVSPPPGLAPGPRTGRYRVSGDTMLEPISIPQQPAISVEDLAVAIVDEVEDPQHLSERFSVGY